MTDNEIQQYLEKHNFEVKAYDFAMDVFNTSPQIIRTRYNNDTEMMTIVTEDNSFTFRWILRKYE